MAYTSMKMKTRKKNMRGGKMMKKSGYGKGRRKMTMRGKKK